MMTESFWERVFINWSTAVDKNEEQKREHFVEHKIQPRTNDVDERLMSDDIEDDFDEF